MTNRRKHRVPSQTERVVASIEELALKPVDQEKVEKGAQRPLKLKHLLSRATDVITVARSASPDPDGFPATTPGNGSPGSGKGGGSTMVVDGERLPTSSTEVAAFASGVRVSDPSGSIGAELERELRVLESALLRIGWALDRWDRLRSPADLKDAPQCWVAAVMHKLPFDEKWEPHRRTTFEGVLDTPWREERQVCRWVYDFTRDHGRLPAEEEMRQYLERGYVRVQTGAATTRQP